jgi:hypothetical protein
MASMSYEIIMKTNYLIRHIPFSGQTLAESLVCPFLEMLAFDYVIYMFVIEPRDH